MPVAAMKNIQAAYRLEIINWEGDPCLPELLKWKGVECSYTNKSTPPRIISLDLSSKKLSGVIVPGFQNLTQLQRLDLSNNSLSGSVPEFLATMKSLSIIFSWFFQITSFLDRNLSWNKLKGRVPQVLRDRKKKGLQLLIDGNPKLCLDDLCKLKNKSVLIPVVASIAGLVLIVASIIEAINLTEFGCNIVFEGQIQPFKSSILTKKRRFTYPEVEAITNNFERVIGEGGFGIVYHGSLSDTEKVAVKLLSQSPTQGYKQFKEEVLSYRTKHGLLIL
ncbi:putative transferase [Arabidopsis thaliana]